MLVLKRVVGETLVIFPTPGIDLNMSVAEMFSAGPISITQVTASEGESSLGVSMPKSLTVIREELAKPDDQTISARE
ncbi:MAG TPA: hypothetical protein DD827_04180 [Gammaproteobacteria bacterium]|nr:hypothetical protein [Gammaproteobacteria bacterium]